MKILLDTNILGRLAQPRQASHAITVLAIEKLLQADYELRLVPQVVYEFWAIATRAGTDNGLGLTIEQTEAKINQFCLVFPPLRDERGILDPWLRLVTSHRVQGKSTHDARLVAAMQRHGLKHILTFNGSDFKRYAGIDALEPGAVANP